jgi:hypothetical protein
MLHADLQCGHEDGGEQRGQDPEPPRLHAEPSPGQHGKVVIDAAARAGGARTQSSHSAETTPAMNKRGNGNGAESAGQSKPCGGQPLPGCRRGKGHTNRDGCRSLSLSDSEYRSAGGRERSSAVWSGGHPHRPVAVFRHRAVAAAKPSGNPPSLARGGAQGVALTPRSVRSRRCHTCPSAHLRVFHAQHQSTTRTQYRVRKLTIQ